MAKPPTRLCCLVTIASIAVTLAACRKVEAPAGPLPPPAPTSETFDAIANRIDPFTEKTRVLVLTDIANEPDDQMSLVRFLVYANQFDVEGLVAGTSTWMRHTVRPDVINHVLDAYETVQPRLATHADGYPTAAALRTLVTTGQPGYGMAAVGSDRMSPGAERIIQAVDRADPRPLWVLAWGGANTLAQALLRVRDTRPPDQVQTFVSKLRVYAISDQDDAGPWIRRQFPTIAYVVMPSTPDGDEYSRATWTGISGDLFYRNSDGADFTTFTDAWVNTHIRSKGPLGKVYIYPCCIHEGDTPSFLGLINNGLASAMSPSFGGWGGRYVWRQAYGETRPTWTQGGDAYAGKDSSRDTVTGIDGRPHTSDQATIWRWRTAFQHDFAARMDWTVADVAHANHNPTIVINGRAGQAPLEIDAQAGAPVTLDATGTADADRDTLHYSWFFYPEAGSGVPGRPVFAGPPVAIGGGGNRDDGGIPSAAAGGPVQPPDRVIIRNANAPTAIVFPRTPGIAHVILAVEDTGTPSLTSYRRVILTIR
jgi:hypothetical protein